MSTISLAAIAQLTALQVVPGCASRPEARLLCWLLMRGHIVQADIHISCKIIPLAVALQRLLLHENGDFDEQDLDALAPLAASLTALQLSGAFFDSHVQRSPGDMLS